MTNFYKKVIHSTLFMLLCVTTLFAQQTITGYVTNSEGAALEGVSVRVVETGTATQTDQKGEFSISAEIGQVLRFTRIGFQSHELTITASHHQVTLSQEADQIDEVVVTAMGIKRERKSLGYSFQEVKAEQITDAKEVNVSNALVGKVSGLQVIKGSAGPASSTKLTLRGNNSLTGDNQPLIIVDGVPMNNFLGSKGTDGMANNDFWNPAIDMGNGLGDINPEDIESISVLKSGAASALYGSRAGNGAIVITTKSGKSQAGTGITYSSTLGLETLFMTPELQSDFGQGANGVFDELSNNNWGPAIAGSPYKAYDNIGNFFNTGVNHTQNVSFQQQFDQTSIYTSATYLNDKSKIPGSGLERLNLMSKVATTFGPNNRWSTDVKVQYMHTDATNRPGSGQNDANAYATLFRLPRTINILDYKDGVDPTGRMLWYGSGSAVNPYWLSKRYLNNDLRNRFLMNANVKYAITDWLDVEARAGIDTYNTTVDMRTYSGSPLSANGTYSNAKNDFSEKNYILALHARDEQIGDSNWGISGSLFGQIMQSKETGLSASTGELEVPDFFTITNSLGNPSIWELYRKKQINSLYATAELNYGGYWYLNLTGRNDWSSSLSKFNRSFFYPSVSTSLVVSDMIRANGGELPSFINFLKVRGSYAAVGNDLAAYRLNNVYGIGQDPNGTTTANYDEVKFNKDVKSELIKTLEFGFDTRLFDSRLGIDFAWYKTNATNQLIELPMDPMSGFRAQVVNAGNIQNSGIEFMIDGEILRSETGLKWNSSVNISKNTNRIIELTDEIHSYPLGGFDNLSIRAQANNGGDDKLQGPNLYGNIYGTKFLRVEEGPHQGKLLLDGNGLPQATGEAYLGNQAPKALIGWTNSFAYKNIGLSFQIDGRFGGEFFSGTNLNLQANGAAAITAPNGQREDFVVDGVIADGDNYVENTLAVSPQQYWTQVASVSGNLGINEANIYDATNIRLRNVTLSYNLPSSVLKSKVLQRARVSFTVNNVWMIKNNAHGIDPESVFSINTNATGFENFSTPTSRSYFFNVTLGF